MRGPRSGRLLYVIAHCLLRGSSGQLPDSLPSLQASIGPRERHGFNRKQDVRHDPVPPGVSSHSTGRSS
ncbi:hypothetical protein C7S13_6574 [Burkholderia cepacia]|nr:hypothetical protein [Burkholderia cepacia]